MKGTLVNTSAVIVGSLLGLLIGSKISQRMNETVMHGLGLVTLLIGIRMAIQGQKMLLVICSLVLGGVVGELIKLEERIEKLGDFVKSKVKPESANFTLGFVTASLVFCVGPMTILGSIQDGINGDASVLYAKSIMDGFASLVFASTLGLGVIFSAFTVLLFQGALTLLGNSLTFLLKPEVLKELTATGGLIILGIGFYLLGIKKIRVANFLPAVIFVVILALIFR